MNVLYQNLKLSPLNSTSSLQPLDVALPKKSFFFISKNAWKKYESAVQSDDENLCELHCVSSKVVSKILHSLKVNKAAGLDKIAARLVRDVDAELTSSIT